jgi:hypothetical protein
LILGHAKRALRKIDAIGPEPAGFRKRTKWINGRQPVLLSQVAVEASRHLARRDQLSDNRRIGLQTLNPMKLLFEADERCYFGQSRCHI